MQLKQEILREKENYRADLINHYRQQVPNSTATHDEIWAELQKIEESAVAELGRFADGRPFVDTV